LVVGILAILKAGGAYVPIDLAYPKDRVAFMLSDSKAPILLTKQALAANLTGHQSRVVCIDADAEAIAAESPDNPAGGATAENLAYVIYTSGSTGKPKGSLITHHNVVRLFRSTEPWFGFNSGDVWTLFHSSAFDFSVWEIWGALFYGGCLVVVPFGVSRSPEAFYKLLGDSGVTVLSQTPSAFRQLIRAEETLGQNPKLALRIVVFGGEALDMKTLKPWYDRHGDQHPRLVNMYGITETTVHVTYRSLTAGDVSRGSVIGVPIPDLTLHLLDDKLHPVPTGETGEICVGGAGVARGYLNRPDLTANKFVPDPFAAATDARLYRSGDLGRFLPDGELEYLGRMDHQIKIRGFRIETGEIESVLSRHPAVRECVVIPRDDSSGEKQLVAYVIRRPGQEVPQATLRELLRSSVPEYMVPASFMFIEQLPLTTNGKLDVGALPAPEIKADVLAGAASFEGNETQREIARHWQEVLHQPVRGLDDNFFDLGGNSISLAEVHRRLQISLGREVPITELFMYTTVRTLAAHLTTEPPSAGSASPAQARAQRQREAQANRRNSRL
jgi:amino acid adenylation domain-containing protein